ncbi:MAG: hypothetical protein HY606_07915 [Planctomycetes bacterium]|nr:hypothetical protein [Planctomycetota bacterium]
MSVFYNKERIRINVLIMTSLILISGGVDDGTGESTTMIPIAPDWAYSIDNIYFPHPLTCIVKDGYILASYPFIMKLTKNGNVSWMKSIQSISGESVRGVYAVDAIAGGGFVLAGYTGSGLSSWDVWVATFDSNGLIRWQFQYGEGPGRYARAFSIQQTFDGGFIVAGNISSGILLSPTDMLLIKLDANGTLQWNLTLGGPAFDSAYSVTQVPDGSYRISGMYGYSIGLVPSASPPNGWVVAIDQNGNFVWDLRFGQPTLSTMVTSVIALSDGSCVIAGDVETLPNSLRTDGFFARIDSNGNIIWMNAFGTTSQRESISSIDLVPNGTVVAIGTASPMNSGSIAIWTIGIDVTGNMVHEWTYDNPNTNDVGISVVPAHSGGFLFAGFSSDKIIVIDTDISGLVPWNGPSGWNMGGTGGIFYTFNQPLVPTTLMLSNPSTMRRSTTFTTITFQPGPITRLAP